MSKYNYNNPIMQEVEKHCDAGHYPICLLESGEYAIFTPCRDGDGCIRRSYQEDTIEACQKSVGATYHSNSHYQPTEIVGFHHPPFKAYKKGDKVKVREDLEFIQIDDRWDLYKEQHNDTAGKVGIIIDNYAVGYAVHFDDIDDWFHYAHHQLEPVLENQETLELTLDEIAEKFGVEVGNIKIKK
jgi:hypothetical protein